MKKRNLLLLACAALLAWACSPNQVCIHIPDNTNHCINDTAAVYWLRQDSGTLKVTKFLDLPHDLTHYPQFGAASTLPNGNYDADITGTDLVLTLPQGSGNNQSGLQVRGDAQFGFFILKTGTETKMISGVTLDCDHLYLEATQAGWTVYDEGFGNGIRVTTAVAHTDLDGTRVMKRKIQTHPEVVRHKGTEVVLIDNFRMERDPSNCCNETCFACCKSTATSRITLPTTFTSDHLPTYQDYLQQAMFGVNESCVSIQCEWLRVADCDKRSVQCFNTQICPADLWISDDLSVGAVYDSACTQGARSRSTCAGTTDGSPMVSDH